ncbi:CheR family methyltransferase [Amycolatopsis alkalitolerans]|uniref:protein-glutamate O-methyltransferase n=1 Tax=Amycolatopsis alkalitolerans TaxID=2547244 RepID=A0A5C4M6W0_9PSEU|nr:CheR family methyltransferase [Amycolatopsis alkalitolerans]TNC29106.1 PAS domain S-box protein [Amycolatopsis alkalitolerans]
MATDPDGKVDSDLETLLGFIRDARGFDFTGYKRSSLARRIRKRMQDVAATEYSDYRDLLETSAEEFDFLFNSILINVTSFFRDTEAWSYLQRDILPELLTRTGKEIRVWSAGCSSGEEAYSLAIAFSEALGVEECIERVKIYGTDVDEEALQEARSGVYPAKSLEPLTTELRDRYFEPSGTRFVFRPDLRRRVIFGRHDITRDAPISRLDLLVCRNTLMYFNVETQNQIIDRFHFALREGGYLFLGKAEMLLSDSGRFDVVSMRRRIFRRRGGRAMTTNPAPVKLDISAGTEVREASRRRLLRDLVLDAAPNAQIVLDDSESVFLINSQARGQFGLTSQDVGRPFRDLEVSYRPTELRSLVEQARTERRTIRLTSVERGRGDDVQYFEVLIQPLWNTNSLWIGTSITFVETTFVTRLQQDLKRHREDLETAYEELQSTNEELETTNEELQSSIEELETTNEELQSGNEELETMNEEMRVRSSELEETRTFLEGVLASVAAGVVVLDGDLRIRSWNREAQELWGLRADEVYQQGFFALDIGLPTEQLRGSIERCVTTKEPSGSIHVDAVNRRGRAITCLVSCSPLDGQTNGVVLLMEEVQRD